MNQFGTQLSESTGLGKELTKWIGEQKNDTDHCIHTVPKETNKKENF